MLHPRPRVRQREPRMPARRPAAHHVVRQFGVELEAERRATVLEGLIAERIAFSQQNGARGQIEALAVPLIDVVGPLEELLARLRRPQRIVADLD